MAGLIDLSNSLSDIKSIILRELQRGGADTRSQFHFVILSTVNNDNPDQRYVVLRKFIPEEKKAFIYTDIRSDKIEQIKVNSNVSVLTYGKSNKCQVKLTGTCSIHHNNDISKMHFVNLNGGKESYNTENSPGEKKDKYDSTQKFKSEFDDEYFAVLEVNVSEMEVLQLNNDGHIRCLFNFDNNEQSWLVP
ncbi:pyridoxamine 5'-phosphate oxidase family protein [Mangrovivirga cuniculi]|uniref:Pyridoxamine 5'-phosphate oxidase Alr4036 family FMN-binding domain-containing protein n=1 Tax=Mangrovivirga cuniculi TaxID=2715131 RepID=A0A4D7JQL3_9BACT|nr:pyridoxamine 5'-phosphate oxidase family protein [Mangrovivirga cuniculi]QCK15780.1 hypothetical protein DCC35_14010 [Mangrovivirga cuniculi]